MEQNVSTAALGYSIISRIIKPYYGPILLRLLIMREGTQEPTTKSKTKSHDTELIQSNSTSKPSTKKRKKEHAKYVKPSQKKRTVNRINSSFPRDSNNYFYLFSILNFTCSSPSVILLLAVPRRLFCFGSLVILDVLCRYLSLFLLYINIKKVTKNVNC